MKLPTLFFLSALTVCQAVAEDETSAARSFIYDKLQETDKAIESDATLIAYIERNYTELNTSASMLPSESVSFE